VALGSRLPATRVLLATALVIAQGLWVAGRFRGLPPYADERHHLRQVQAFCSGSPALDPKLTTVPGFHLLAAAAGRLTGDCSLASVRALNAVIGLASVAAFAFAAAASGAADPALRTLQYAALPVLLPYHFLAYTDSAPLALLLLSAGLLLRGRSVAAGLAAAASLLFRQSNVVWLLFVALWVLRSQPALTAREALRRLWPCLLGLLGFGVFVLVNGGIALGDARAHRAGLHLGNVFFALLLAGVLLLPRQLWLLATERARLLSPRVLGVLALAAAFFAAGFGVAHAYNRFPDFLRNQLLMAADESWALRAALLVPLLLGLAGLLLDRPLRPADAALWPATLLALLPVKLIDQRYAFVPLVLHQLLRRDAPAAVEWATLGLWAALGLGLVEGIARGAFLL
jgi:alpha-1,2-glucosyltransferase